LLGVFTDAGKDFPDGKDTNGQILGIALVDPRPTAFRRDGGERIQSCQRARKKRRAIRQQGAGRSRIIRIGDSEKR
jgi:hypothetical protein